MSQALTPRPHQVSALADLVAAFALRDRVQLVMACDIFPSQSGVLR